MKNKLIFSVATFSFFLLASINTQAQQKGVTVNNQKAVATNKQGNGATVVKGEAKATYILGIGGLAKQTLVDNAKQKMIVANKTVEINTITAFPFSVNSSYKTFIDFML